MSSNHPNTQPGDEERAPQAAGRVRLWIERLAIGLVAVISLLLPVLFGLLFYLAVTDGLVINANDPLHEVRLWMVRERRGATGVGLTTTTAADGPGTAQCARTDVTFIKWDRSLRLETDGDYCRCYENRDGQLVDANITCP